MNLVAIGLGKWWILNFFLEILQNIELIDHKATNCGEFSSREERQLSIASLVGMTKFTNLVITKLPNRFQSITLFGGFRTSKNRKAKCALYRTSK